MSLKEVSYAQQGCVYLIKKQKYYKLHNSFCINIIQNVIYFCDGKAEFLAAITCMYTVLLLKVNIRAKHQKWYKKSIWKAAINNWHGKSSQKTYTVCNVMLKTVQTWACV